jgi:thiamine biosynthesis lipoprotein ApbE
MKSYEPPFRRTKPALGTFFEILITGVDFNIALELTDHAFKEVFRLEKVFSFFDAESELLKLNQSKLNQPIPVSAELWDVLILGNKIESRFPGTFRLMPTCPHESQSCYSLHSGYVIRLGACRFDLGGIAKGYIVDHIFEMLSQVLGDNKIIINAGGDLRCSGSEIIEIRIPGRKQDARFALPLCGGAIATSSLQGDFSSVGITTAKFELKPIIKIQDLASVSVVASSCTIADALTKVVLLGSLEENDFCEFSIKSINKFDATGGMMDSFEVP